MGFDTSDDAAVYKINDQLAMVQTVDFFPPIVDDPYIFGQIAAANALSDVYAMGGEVKLAMNLICFPSCLELSVMEQILQGGYSKVQEAGGIIAGGHTIEDDVPKYGLCVTGYAHPKDILANSTAKEGDLLILTKALGTGVLSTAYIGGLLPEEHYKAMCGMMTRLNKYAQQAITPVGANACTDITGFGLLGHAYEMASGSKKTIELYSNDIPVVPYALQMAREGLVPEGAYNNMSYLEGKVTLDSAIPLELQDLLYDPQTAGGLLISLPESKACELIRRLEDGGDLARVVGQVKAYDGMSIRVR